MNRHPDFRRFEREWGISFTGAVDYLKPEWKYDFELAMDAQPTLISTPNSGIPAFLTTFVDPDLLRVLTAKNAAVEIIDEVRKGDWVDTTAIFPMVEHTGEVSSYGDFSANGRAKANSNFPQRQAYLYQVVVEYGERELEQAGRARINWASELKTSSVNILNKFQNLTYFYGVSGLQNYGLLNDPSLPTPIAPATKAAGGLKWWNGTALNATANEIFADIQSLFVQLVSQSSGNIDEKTPLVLALSPKSRAALTATNQYNVNVEDLIRKNFPSLEVKTAIQYGASSAQNPQGSAAGEVVQLIAKDVEGQKSAYAAFNEKLRAGAIIRDMSSFKQKMTQGSWGAIIRQPFAIAQMIGV
jgi:Trp operon repressor